MRKTLATIALLAVLGALAVSCQKETIIDETTIVTENDTYFMVSYSVDGITNQITLIGEDAWHDFLNYMFVLAEEGHKVSFRNEEASSRTIPSKDVVTYTTTSREEAYSWANRMADMGYIVTIKFNKESGVYTCEAVI